MHFVWQALQFVRLVILKFGIIGTGYTEALRSVKPYSLQCSPCRAERSEGHVVLLEPYTRIKVQEAFKKFDTTMTFSVSV